MSYFLLSDNEDGGYYVDDVTDRVDEAIAEHMDADKQPTFAASLAEADRALHVRTYADPGVLILIKGQVIVPKPVQVVTEWRVE